MGHDGATYERAAVDFIEEHGWYAQRTGASGGGTDKDRPDIIASKSVGKLSFQLMIEMKSWKKGYGSFSKEEVHALERVAERSGGYAVVLIWPDLRKHSHRYIYTTEALNENEKSYSVRKSDLEDGMSLEALLGMEAGDVMDSLF